MPRDVHRDDMWYGDHEDDEPDDGTRPADAGAYWRRRFLILCAGVVVLGACALLFPGAHHAQSQPSAAASASMAAKPQAEPQAEPERQPVPVGYAVRLGQEVEAEGQHLLPPALLGLAV
jgi:hypothetical protein